MMMVLARQEEGTSISLGEVSKLTLISRRYLDQLATALKNASLVRGISGKAGGYQLTKPANEIQLREIIDATIGPVSVVDCAVQPEVCVRSDGCECRLVYELLTNRINQVFEFISLSDLIDGPELRKKVDLLDCQPTG